VTAMLWRSSDSPRCGVPVVAVAQCRQPGPDSFKVAYVSLPLARGLGSASGPGRRFGLRQPPDPHKGGNQR